MALFTFNTLVIDGDAAKVYPVSFRAIDAQYLCDAQPKRADAIKVISVFDLDDLARGDGGHHTVDLARARAEIGLQRAQTFVDPHSRHHLALTLNEKKPRANPSARATSTAMIIMASQARCKLQVPKLTRCNLIFKVATYTTHE